MSLSVQNIPTIKDLDLKGKKVLIRVDFNVPMNGKEITDDRRIQASLPTIKMALEKGAAVILMSHLGRPDGKPSLEYSLSPCAKRLSELLQKPVEFAEDCIGKKTEKQVQNLKPRDVLLLENLRFHAGEEHPEKEPDFAKKLASLGDIFINDAFGTAHRAHASNTEIVKYFPGKAAIGLLMEKELKYLGQMLLSPSKPFVAVLGGAKISSKFPVIQALMKKADLILIGGAMSYTFFKAQGIEVGNSLYEPEFVTKAAELLKASSSACRLVLPVDVVVTKEVKHSAEHQVVDIQKGIEKGYEAVDIGPKTVELYQKELQKAKTVFWNGPVGIFECPPFNRGTNEIARIISQLSATTVVGGGDTIAAIEQIDLADAFSFLSTGGGATLEFIELDGNLPAIKALRR